MIVIFSGEGPTDLGQSATGTSPCYGADFIPGPMAALVDNAIEQKFDYSIFAPGMESAWFISETVLANRAKQQSRRKMMLRGSKHPEAETGYFFKNAEMLALEAIDLENKYRDKAIAVLFRDNDGTRSAAPTLWETKFQSMNDGFKRAQFARGVAMLAKPKSEAWLMGIARKSSMPDCAALESLPGNDDSPNSAKKQLLQHLGRHHDGAELFDWVKQNQPDFSHLATMPSFAAFHTQLHTAMDALK